MPIFGCNRSKPTLFYNQGLSSHQEGNELLATLREFYNLLISLGLDLALQDPVPLQHPYTGLDNTTFGRLKDGKSSDAIVGEQNHLEDNPIFSPSMPTLDDFYKPLNPSLTQMNPLMFFLLNLLTIL